MAVTKYKREYPPLLPQGFHRFSLKELEAICVAAFPSSSVRAEIFAGFQAVYERAVAVDIDGEVWVDGSFLTKKIDPEDIDFIFLIAAGFYDDGSSEQQEFIDWLISNEDDPKKSFLCHTDVVLVYPEESPLYANLTVETKRHWEKDVYGFSVTTKEPKGIVIVLVEEPEQRENKDGEEREV